VDARSVIARLRDREELSPEQLAWFANGLASGAVTDAQAGAFAMAVLLNGMTAPERVALTLSMRDSGVIMRWDLPGPVIDKHSTGGIGDAVSLLLAPALAALGAYVPMVSGRGLGHTGGTLDKLEAIPGVRTEVGRERFRAIVEGCGFAIVSASEDIAPADRRLYAIRDVTATVESIDLITASILSKKLAAGLEALVLDVKTGSGAFMKTPDDAIRLAETLVQTANGAGCRTSALVTDMNQPCASSVGNALEVMEAMEALTGGARGTILVDLAARLGGELLAHVGMAGDAVVGAQQLREVLVDGSAAERFGRMVAELGGPGDFVERWRDRLPAARVLRPVAAGERGYVAAIDGTALGLAVVALGGGRRRQDDRIDPTAGLSEVVPIGEAVSPETPLAVINAASEEAADAVEGRVRAAFTVSRRKPAVPPLVHRSIR